MRVSRDSYFMSIAHLAAKRSTCIRRQVGAIIVKEDRVVSTGYNGAPRGLVHCGEVGCLREQLKIPSGERQELCRAAHAEQNAIIQAAVFGISVCGAKMYITTFPCSLCAKMIVNAGISEVVYEERYADTLAEDILRAGGVVVRRLCTSDETYISH